MPEMKSIAVYCGSASPPDERYIALAEQVGRSLVARGVRVVYGGGRLGLMGALADSALAAGGEVFGVIPDALVNREIAHNGLTQLETVANMHERKARFTQLSDGFLVLPGGVGTMDELWEALSWSQLGYHAKPVGLLNALGYYDGLLAFARHMTETGFVREQHSKILLTDTDLDALLAKMIDYRPHAPIFEIETNDL